MGLGFRLSVGSYQYQQFFERAWFVIFSFKSMARHNNMKPGAGEILSITTVLGNGSVISHYFKEAPSQNSKLVSVFARCG